VNLDEDLISGVSSQYYSTPDGLNAAVVASYSQLRNFYGREQLLSLTQVGTDTWMAADQAGSNNKDFDNYGGGLNATVAPLANTWNPAYQAINTLNAALERGPNTEGISPTVKKTLLAEAHFLRALNYFTLVQTFGDVTLQLKENQESWRRRFALGGRRLSCDPADPTPRWPISRLRRTTSGARRRVPRSRCGPRCISPARTNRTRPGSRPTFRRPSRMRKR
jgi:hypothetical protein